MSIINKDFEIICQYLQNPKFMKDEMKLLLDRFKDAHLSKTEDSQETISSGILNLLSQATISEESMEMDDDDDEIIIIPDEVDSKPKKKVKKIFKNS